MEPNENRLSAVLGKLDATVANDAFEAGRVNTARIILKNPFDVPVVITEIQAPKSTTLADLHKPNPRENDQEQPVRGPFSLTKAHLSFGLGRGLLSTIFNLIGLSGEISFGTVSPNRSRKVINISAEKGSEIAVERDLPAYDELNIVAQPDSKVLLPTLRERADSEQPARSLTIAPHCEIVEYFPFKTTGWLLFKPARLPVNIQITYNAASNFKTQVVDATLEVKPPLASMIIGTLIGSVLGTLARVFTHAVELDAKRWSIAIGSSVVMGLIATIALSRKTGSQGFITVEDFFGAFVVGTLIGYLGSNYFDSIVDAQASSLHSKP